GGRDEPHRRVGKGSVRSICQFGRDARCVKCIVELSQANSFGSRDWGKEEYGSTEPSLTRRSASRLQVYSTPAITLAKVSGSVLAPHRPTPTRSRGPAC